MPAHVTLLTPFVAPAELDAGVVLELRSLFAATAPFRLTLARIGRFPGVVYLAPEPAEPFVRLTEAVVARYPAYPPYGGAHETIVPHLTVASTEDEGVLDQAAEAVAAGLPLAAWVEEVWLMEEISKVWERRERFPLRGL